MVDLDLSLNIKESSPVFKFSATVQGMKPRKRRREGASETVGVSLDPRTKQKLKQLAAERLHLPFD